MHYMVSTWLIHGILIRISEHFGIVLLDVEDALFLWHVEEFSRTGSVKALSRAGISSMEKLQSIPCVFVRQCVPANMIHCRILL